MTIRDFLDYEIRASWWASWIWFGWGQNLTARYFAWKTKRKYNRYIDNRLDKAMVELMRQCQDETPNDRVEGPDAASSRTVTLDGWVGRQETTKGQ